MKKIFKMTHLHFFSGKQLADVLLLVLELDVCHDPASFFS